MAALCQQGCPPTAQALSVLWRPFEPTLTRSRHRAIGASPVAIWERPALHEGVAGHMGAAGTCLGYRAAPCLKCELTLMTSNYTWRGTIWRGWADMIFLSPIPVGCLINAQNFKRHALNTSYSVVCDIMHMYAPEL